MALRDQFTLPKRTAARTKTTDTPVMCEPAQQLLTGAQQTASRQAQVRMKFVLDEDKQIVVSKNGRRSYTVFGKAAVMISVEETSGHRRQLRLMLVDHGTLR